MNKKSKYNQLVEHNGRRKIYNALTKASIEIEDDFDLQNLENFKEEELAVLKQLGILVDDLDDEFRSLRYMFNKNYYGGENFLNIVLVPGLDCNFKCPYCFEKVKGGENLFCTNTELYFSVLKKFAYNYLSKYETVEISLFGGEPLLFANQIFDFFEYIECCIPELSYFSSIVTNGSLLNKTILNKLLKYNCRSMQITIDGWKGAHDKSRIFMSGKETYNLLIDNINEIMSELSEKCQFILRINLSNVTVEEVKSTLLDIDSQHRKKIKILFRPIYNTDCFQQKNTNKYYDLKLFYDLAFAMGFDIVRNTYYHQACEACSGDNFFFIMPDLTLWKCINDVNFKQAQIGKITEDGLLQFDAKKLIQWYTYSNCFEDEKCIQCKMLPDCYGGCVLYNAKNGLRLCKEFEMAALPYLY